MAESGNFGQSGKSKCLQVLLKEPGGSVGLLKFGHNATIKKRPLKEKVTTLSDYVWKLKDQKVPFTIKWAIKSKAYAFSSGGKSCDLCITEKMTIMLADQRYSLNQRKELLSKCPHKRQFCLKKHSENSTIT